MKRVFDFLIALLLIFGLSGCAHTLDAKLIAARDVNPNIYNKPSPVVVVLYQLKDIGKFDGADFNSLYQNPQQALGDDFVSMQQVEVAPGRTAVFKTKLDKKTKYLGVVAAYSNIDQAVWRQYVEFKSTWATENINVYVNRNRINIDYLL